MQVGRPPANLDMLSWFTEDERHECGVCGDRACVTVEGAKASFCLSCGAIIVDGRQLPL